MWSTSTAERWRPARARRETHLVTEVYAYALDAESRLRDTLTQAFRLDLGRYRKALSERGVKFLGRLDLVPGDYSLRVLVLHRRAGRLGLRVVPLAVPAREGPALTPPIFPEPIGRWIVAREAGGGLLFPLDTGGDSWVPTTRPRLEGEAASELYLLGHRLTEGLRARVLATGGGEERAELGLGELRPVTGGPPGMEMLAARLQATRLPAGDYTRDYTLQVSTAGEAAAASLPLVVAPARRPPHRRCASRGTRCCPSRRSAGRAGSRRSPPPPSPPGSWRRKCRRR